MHFKNMIDKITTKKNIAFLVFSILIIGLVVSQIVRLASYKLRASVTPATLSLSDTQNAVVGTTLSIPVYLNNNGNPVAGVDAQIQFDRTLLQLVDVQMPVASAQIFGTYLPITADGVFNKSAVIENARSTGIVTFSAVSYDLAHSVVQSPITTSAKLINLVFTPIKAGTADVSFVYDGVSTTDTNIISSTTSPVDLITGSSSLISGKIIITDTNQSTPVPTVTPVGSTPAPTPIATIVPQPTATPTGTVTLPSWWTLLPTSLQTSGEKFLSYLSSITSKFTLFSFLQGVSKEPSVIEPSTEEGVHTAILKAVADSYTSSTSPSRNYGTTKTLYVDGKPKKYAFLAFDLSGIPAGSEIKSATLYIQTTSAKYSGSPSTQTVRIAGYNWNERQITYRNQPEIGSVDLGTIAKTKSNTVYKVELSPTNIKDYFGRNVNLVFYPKAGEDAFYFYSRETTLPPNLVIEYK